MNYTLSFEQYPAWYLIFCVLIGLIYAALLYFKDNSFAEATQNQKRAIIPMSIFRWLAVSTIAFLLLAPLLKSKFIDVVKPYILILQDNSQSIANSFGKIDSAEYKKNIQQLKNQLGEQYQVDAFSFGNKTEPGLPFTFNNKVTDISQALDELYNTYNNQNVGAIILASDGIFNQGSNPLYNEIGLNAPIYSIALGDTTPKRDILITRALHNKIAYLGDKFTIRADILAKNCNSENTVLSVFKESEQGNKLYSKSIAINNQNFVASEDIIINADQAGIQHYIVKVNAISNEITTQNNKVDVYIEVLDNRQKVLLLAASPNPDIATIKQALEVNKNYETTAAFASTFTGSVKEYNMAILHGLPNEKFNIESTLKQLKENNIPIWFIISSQTSSPLLNKAQTILQINGAGNSMNDVKAEMQNNFNLFTFDADIAKQLPNLPPLAVPFGDFKASPTAQVLLKQQIGSVSTNYPLLVLEQASGYKTAVLCGEGLWRWKMTDFMRTQTNTVVNEIVSKIAQYLTVKNDKRKFRVSMPKNLFNENEQITFDAELYNDSYELINQPEVNITIYNNESKAFPFVFNKTSNAYTLNTGFLPVGSYTYKAGTTYNNEKYTAQGAFSIAPIQLETLQTTANHQLLSALSKKFGGELIPPDSILNIANKIKVNPNIKPTQYSSYKTQSIINLRWIFGLLILLLTVEWFLRKYLGKY